MADEHKDFGTLIELAPPFLRLPVVGYGGTERVLWSLVKEFSRKQQNDPTAPRLELWATADCERTANGVIINLVPTADKALGFTHLFTSNNQGNKDMYRLRGRLEDDPTAVGHIHSEDTGFMAFGGASRDVISRTLTTIHNLPKEWSSKYAHEMPVVAISKAQARKVKGFDFVEVVHNGIDADFFKPNFSVAPDAPFSYLGRFSVGKNPRDAISIAVACDARINLAGVPDPDNPAYMADVNDLAARHSDKVTMVGEVSDIVDPATGMSSKNKVLANSRALLFPIKWEEPFGLVIAEANACGTPVIAYNYPGSAVDELIVNGVNGFKVNSMEEAVEAARKVGDLDRRKVRQHFDEHLTSSVMADNYLRIMENELPKYRKDLGIDRPGRLSLVPPAA